MVGVGARMAFPDLSWPSQYVGEETPEQKPLLQDGKLDQIASAVVLAMRPVMELRLSVDPYNTTATGSHPRFVLGMEGTATSNTQADI